MYMGGIQEFRIEGWTARWSVRNGTEEWIKGTLTIPNQVYMKKLIVSIKI
jgi:hypothetical protein